MNLTYCDKWSIGKKKPWNYIDESEAKLRHQRKETYSAIMNENNKVMNIVEVTNRAVIVYFLDEKLCSYLSYVFRIVDENNIFLNTATYYSYDGLTDIKKECTMVSFEKNGYIIMEQKDLFTNISKETDFMNDVSMNWDVLPEFGQYQSLCRKER